MGIIRHCNPCDTDKPLEEFVRCRTKPLGHHYLCLACNRMKVRRVNKGKKRFRRAYPVTNKLATARYKLRYPLKQEAHRQATRALKRGELLASPCERCGQKAQMHHDDYAKPLDVRWLCRKHHHEHHQKLGPGANGESPETLSIMTPCHATETLLCPTILN